MEKELKPKSKTNKKRTTKKVIKKVKKPTLKSKISKTIKKIKINLPKKNVIPIELENELVVESNPKSRISEAIKSIKTNLQFTAIDQNIKTLMITSSIPGEGKSFIASNLACAFAGSDMKVLVIDCDLRKGRQHKIFDISNNKGLSNLLIDDIKTRKSYIKDTKYKNIKVIPAGVVPPNPSELLGSKKNKKLIDTLRKEYDLIILDCPPVNGLADALVMTSLADSIVIVCAQNKTKVPQLNETKRILTQLNANVTGVIMNKVDLKDSDDYYYYRYYN